MEEIKLMNEAFKELTYMETAFQKAIKKKKGNKVTWISLYRPLRFAGNVFGEPLNPHTSKYHHSMLFSS